MNSAQDFANTVDSLTGQVALALPLMILPGPPALQVPVGLSYGSTVKQTVYGWNLSAPTGVAGLGWDLPRSAVVSAASYGTDLGDAELVLVLNGLAVPLIPTATTIASGQQWLATTQPGWQVGFNAGAQTWTVIDEDGTSYLFGGLSTTGSIEFAVKVGDWLASTNEAEPQSQFPTVWNLASITDLFGNTCQFFYESVTSTLGADGLSYTQASYLSQIEGAWGDTITFTYVEKESYEYALPYSDPPPPNAYQPRLATRALDQIVLRIADATQPLMTAELAYSTTFNVADPNNTAFNKRVLTGITLSYPNGYSLPQLLFTYATSGANPGALASVTTQEGAVVTYGYSTLGDSDDNALQYTGRTVALAAPVAGGITYTVLGFLFEDAYTVALWSGSDQSVVIAPYRWEGRWLAGATTTISGATTAGAAVISASAPGLFAVVAANTVYSFALDPQQPAGWIAGTAGLASLAPSGTTGYQVAAGDRFVAVVCQPSGTLLRIDFASLSWSDTQTVSTSLPAQNGYGLAAQGNKLLLAGVAADALSLWLAVRGANGAWTSNSVATYINPGTAPSVTALFCVAGAGLMTLGSFGGDQRYASFASAFESNGLAGPLASLAQGGGTPDFEAAGMTIRTAGVVSRFDGRDWIDADLASLGMPAGATLGTITIGPDIAARAVTLSGGAARYDLVTYDANQGAWSVAASANAPAQGAGVAVAPRMPRGSGRYAVLGNALYYMSSDQSWSPVSNGALPTLAAGDAASVQVLGDSNLLYQTASASTATAWFLGNGTTTATDTASSALLLVPDQDPDFLVGEAAFVTYQGSWNGADLALTLRRPVGQAIQGTQTAAVVSSVGVTSGYASQAVVVAVPGASTQSRVELLGDGLTNYTFAFTAATMSADGTTPLFNGTTVAPSGPPDTTASVGQLVRYQFNGLSASETPLFPAPTATGVENTAQNASIVLGLPYAVIPEESNGTQTALTENYWFATVVPETAGYVAYTRQRRVVTTLDGVSSTADWSYDTSTGLVTTSTSSYVDASGSTIATTETSTYFWQEYDQQRSLNILSPVVQTQTSATVTPSGGTTGMPQTLAGAANTWRQDWGGGATGWAPCETFRQTSADAATFDAWMVGEPTPAGWQQVAAVAARAPSGLATAGIDVNNVPTISLTDQLGRFAYAGAAGSDRNSLSYYGCEPYEEAGGWQVLSGGALSSYLTTSDAHTGTTSLMLPGGTGAAQFINYYQPSDLTRIYVFGCWARSPSGFSGSGIATADITASWTKSGVAGQATLAVLTLSSSTNSNWIYIQSLLNIPAALNGVTPDTGSFVCEVLLSNANTGATNSTILLDELRLSPMSATFSALTIDTTRWLQTSAIDTNGQSVQAVYDGWLQPVATIGPDAKIMGASFSGLSRLLPGVQGTFSPWWPNSTVSLAPGGQTQYDDFHGDTSANWTFTDAGGSWSVGNGVLDYSGTAASGEVLGGTARPKSANTANFAARVIVDPLAGSSPALGDGTIFLRWEATANSDAGAFALVSAASDGTVTTLQTPSTTVPLGSDWLFIAVDGFYLCMVNGVSLFSYIRADGAPSGAGLTLASNGSAEFDELIRLDDPSVTLSCFDAMARLTQTIGLIGGSAAGSTNAIMVQVAARFYDSFSRPAVIGLPLTGNLVLATSTGALPSGGTVQTLPDESPTQYLVPSQDDAAAVTTYVESGLTVAGMPSSQLTYNWATSEASPVGRPLAALPVRSANASNGTGYQRSWSYQGLAALPASMGADDPAALVYRQTELYAQTALNGTTPVTTVVGEVRTQDGRLLQQSLGPSTSPTQMVQSVTYTLGGLIATRAQANAAATPQDTTAATWNESYTYDFLGRPEVWTSSDRGVTSYAYDGANRLRFLQDSAGAAASPARFNYNRYDSLGRLIEQGWIDDSNYAWGSTALEAELDNQSFPNVPGGTGSGTQVSGRWRNQFSYDTDGNAQTLNTLGRLCQARSQPDSSSSTDSTATSYGYDDYGQVTSVEETLTLNGATSTATTGYGYDSAGRRSAIIYPALDSNNPSVGYYYDRLGRLAGVGDVVADGAVVDPSQPVPEPEVRYAGYQYGTVGQLGAIGLNRPATAAAPAFTRTLSYAQPARIAGIDDPYLSLAFGYTGIDGTANTTQRLASTNAIYQVSANWTTPPTPFGFAYGYDTQGRLTDAVPATPSTNAFGFAAPTGNGYDANGNRLNWSRGVTGYAAAYPVASEDDDDPQPGAPGNPANGMVSLAPSVSQNITFADATGSTAGPWAWGSSNGGPSTSSLAGSSGAQYLELGGGNALGHYEVLVLDTWLDPASSLQLVAETGTDPGYPTTGSQAAWTLTLYAASGIVAETTLQYVPAGSGAGTWTQQTISVDVAAAAAASGYAGELTRARLALQNMTRGATDGAAGAAVYVNFLNLTWPTPPIWNLDYDDNGSVTSDTQIGLSPVTYDYLSYQATTATRGSNTQSWLRNSAGQSVAATLTTGTGAVTALNHFGLDGRLIAQSVTQGGQTQACYFVNGLGGPVAIQQAAGLSFMLNDQLGSIRAIVDGGTGAAQASFDYQPFGGLARSSGAQPGLARFTNHWPDPAIDLMPTPARLLDNATGRFLQVDPRYDGLSPYSYAINNPANLTDPTGEFWQAVVVSMAIEGGMNVYENYSPDNTIGQNLGYFGAGAASGFWGLGTSLGYVGPFSLAAGTHFLLAGVAQSAATGGLRDISREWLNRHVSGNWSGYDDSAAGYANRFAHGAAINAGTALAVGIAGIAVGRATSLSRGVAADWYDFGNLYQAFYEPTGDYSDYSKRLTKVFTALGLNFPRRRRGTRLLRWFELEHTLPQRWFKDALEYLRVWTNTPVLLIPVLPWINTPLLEGTSLIWAPVRLFVSQPALGNGNRLIYAPLVIAGLAAGTGGAFYGGYQLASGWWNGPSGAPPPPLSQEL